MARNLLRLLIIAAACAPTSRAESISPRPLVREIFVPYEALEVILPSGGERVFLDRDQYQELLEKANVTAKSMAPVSVALLSSQHQATIQDRRLQIVSKLVLDVANDGWHSVPLPLKHVGVQRAILDGAVAPIARSDSAAEVMLFVRGKGVHELILELNSTVEIAAAEQTVRFQLPTAAAGMVRLEVPGDVELKSGADVIRRDVDAGAGVTRFELLPSAAEVEISLSLNNRLAQDDHVVLARGVHVGEITETYERIHLTASMDVVRGSTDRFRFAIPADFDVISVATPHLSHWSVVEAKADDDRADRHLEVTLHQPVSETVVLTVSAQRDGAQLDPWNMPLLKPVEVDGVRLIMGILLDRRLEMHALESDRLIPVDVQVLVDTLPPSVLEAEPAAPALRAMAAFYAPTADFRVTAQFAKPASRVRVASSAVLTVSDAGLEVQGGFALMPLAEKIFGCNFRVAPGWRVVEVTYGDRKPLAFQQVAQDDQTERIHVELPVGVLPGQTYRVFFRAKQVPAGWLDDWSSRTVAFPRLTVDEASTERGAIAVVAADDLEARTLAFDGLLPLDERRKAQFHLGDIATDLAFHYEVPEYEATFEVTRLKPRATAETLSFLKIAPGSIHGHYELIYEIAGARTRRLAFELPLSTPDEVAIRALGDAAVKESTSTTQGDVRRWEVLLEKNVRGVVRLEAKFHQRLDVDRKDLGRAAQQLARDYPLPIASAVGVAYQSGTFAVEGHAELEIGLVTAARKVDIGELVEAEYVPGKRLLGAYSFLGKPAAATVNVTRPGGYALPTALVERAVMATSISDGGLAQSKVGFRLRTKASFAELELPAGSMLWSAWLDGAAARPQRDGDRLLVSLPAKNNFAGRRLEIVYETPVSKLGTWGRLSLPAPRLFVRNSGDTESVELPVADLQWHVSLPHGYVLSSNSGTVFPDWKHGQTAAHLGRRPVAALHALSAVLDWPQSKQARRVEPPRIISQSGLARSTPGRVRASNPASGIQSGQGELGVDQESMGLQGFAGIQRGDSSERLFDSVWETADARARREYASGEPTGAGAATAAPQVPLANGAKRFRGEAVDNGSGLPAQASTPEMPVERAPQSAEVSPQSLGTQSPGAQSLGTMWRLRGLRSLDIDLLAGDNVVAFRSLGRAPRLDVGLIDSRRFEMLSWALAVAVFAGGLILLRGAPGGRTRYVLLVLIAATALPVGLGWEGHHSTLLDRAFYAGLALGAFYIVMGILTWFKSRIGLEVAAPPATAALLVALLLGGGPAGTVRAAEREPAPTKVQLVEPMEPVAIPDDAVIIPIDIDDPDALRNAERVLVPRAKYTQLWKLAFPGKKSASEDPPVPYLIAESQWRASLDDGRDLVLAGELLVDVLDDKPVAVVLPLAGGVLARAEADGQPARIHAIQPENAQPQAQQQASVDRTPPALLAVLLEKKGRQRVQLEVRFRRTRRGGWHVVRGLLPVGAASALRLDVPRADTELRLSGVVDRSDYETTSPAETITTALGSRGTFTLQWRPKVASATVDRALTARSSAVVDVQEDRLVMVWQIQLKFPQSERDVFSVRVPDGFTVEKVEGDNIRTWKVADGQMTVQLLTAATDRAKIVLQLSRAGAVQPGGRSELEIPAVEVPGALLHDGKLIIRRSPLIEIHDVVSARLTRTNLESVDGVGGDGAESPLGIRPHLAFAFPSTDFTLRFTAAAVESRLQAEVQTLLRMSDLDRTLECRLLVQPSGRPLYQLHARLPADMIVEKVRAPGAFDWSVERHDDHVALRVFMGTGQATEFSVVVEGLLGERGPVEVVALPQIVIPAAERQQSTIVVQTDPGRDAVAENLSGCQTSHLRGAHSWLAETQRSLARLAVRCKKGEYSGRIRLVRKEPRVRCQTISNLRVTGTALEETMMLDFTIEQAGAGELAFRLPGSLANARIQAPLLRSKTMEPIDESGEVRVVLKLQYEIMGQYRVLVENDSLLPTDAFTVAIPSVETGSMERQFVTVENAGYHEMIVDDQQELQGLTRESSQWSTLAAIFEGGMTKAFVVDPSARAPKLSMRLRERQIVETVGAQIPFAETQLVVDGSGAYRGAQVFQVDNRTEQFLEILLPKSATLWTAEVAGDPVKPVAGSGQVVRIPLVKTELGDRDYRIVLKYGGTIDAIDRIASANFPLIQAENIKVQRSQVRLWLPETHRWFNFDGTMRLVTSEPELIGGYLDYRTRQLYGCTNNLKQLELNPYIRLRAANNAKAIVEELQQYHASGNRDLAAAKIAPQVKSNLRAVAEAERLLGQLDDKTKAEAADNRDRLNDFVKAQFNRGITNEALGYASNFGRGPVSGRDGPRETEDSARPQGQIQGRWLTDNSLRGSRTEQARQAKQRVDFESDSWREAPNAPAFARGKDEAASRSGGKLKGAAGQPSGRRNSEVDKLERYSERLGKMMARGRAASPTAASASSAGEGYGAGGYGGGGGFGGGGDSNGSRPGGAGGMGGGGGHPAEVDLPQAQGPTPIGLASLELTLPRRGVPYFFTTPRGDTAITARAIHAPLWGRILRLLACLAALAIGAMVVRTVRRHGFDRLFGRAPAALAILAGAMMLYLKIAPAVAIGVLLLGAIQLVRHLSPLAWQLDGAG